MTDRASYRKIKSDDEQAQLVAIEQAQVLGIDWQATSIERQVIVATDAAGIAAGYEQEVKPLLAAN